MNENYSLEKRLAGLMCEYNEGLELFAYGLLDKVFSSAKSDREHMDSRYKRLCEVMDEKDFIEAYFRIKSGNRTKIGKSSSIRDLYNKGFESYVDELVAGDYVSEDSGDDFWSKFNKDIRLIILNEDIKNAAKDLVRNGKYVPSASKPAEDSISGEGTKVLRIDADAIREREKAYVNAMSAPFRNMIEDIEQRREERYQEMIDELPMVESPMSRRGMHK